MKRPILAIVGLTVLAGAGGFGSVAASRAGRVDVQAQAAPALFQDVPKTEANRKLAADLLRRIIQAYYSVVETEATGFDAAFAVLKNGVSAGRAKSAWDSDAGETTTKYQGSLAEDDARWLETIANLGLFQSVFTEGDHDQLFAMQTGDGFLLSDYRAANETVLSRQVVISSDLAESGEYLRMRNGVVRRIVRKARKNGERLFVVTARILIETPEGAKRSDDYAFQFALKDGLPFPEKMNIADVDTDGVSTAWTLNLDQVSFARPAKPAPERKSPAPRALKLDVKETPLGARPAEAKDAHPTIAPDGRHVAFVIKRGAKSLAVIDGVEGPAYDEISKEGVVFAPESGRYGYRARKGQSWVVAIDGQEGKPYGAVSELVFSRDGRRFLYRGARTKTSVRLVVDGQEGQESEAIGNPAFSPDGKRIAYAQSSASSKRMIVDGRAGNLYIALGPPVFSADSAHVAYAAGKSEETYVIVLDGREIPLSGRPDEDRLIFSPDGQRLAVKALADEKWRLQVDGREGPAFENIWTILFSPDGRHVAYKADQGAPNFVVLDGAVGPAYESVDGESMKFNADGSRFGYIANKGTKQVLWVGGKESEAYDYVDNFAISPAKGRVAFVGTSGKQSRCVVDGLAGPWYDRIYTLLFSPDGGRYAYNAQRAGKELMVLDGKEAPPADSVSDMAFSPDGRRLAVRVKNGDRKSVVVDGQAGKSYDDVDPPLFTPDGRHLIYRAKRGDNWLVVADGVESRELPRAGGVYGYLHFAGPSTVYAVADRDGALVRVEVQIVE